MDLSSAEMSVIEAAYDVSRVGKRDKYTGSAYWHAIATLHKTVDALDSARNDTRRIDPKP